MTKLTNFISSLVILVVGGFIFASCTQNTTSTITNPPSNLTAAATSASTIVVRWTRDPSDTTADTIEATTSNGSIVNPTIVPFVPAPDTTGILTGLDTGVTYTISVHSTTHVSSTLLVTTDPPVSLRALSLNSTTINVVWTRAQGDASLDTAIAIPMSGGGPPVSVTIVPPNTIASITGLANGIVYSISVHSTAGTTNTFQPNFQWMTAYRTTGIKIFESGDTIPTDPSALLLGDSSTAAILSGLKNADFVLETDTTAPAGITLVSGQAHNPAWTDDTKIDPDSFYVIGGLDANYDSSNYSAAEARAAQANLNGSVVYGIPNDNATAGSRILIVTTAGNNLALVEIVPDDITSLLYSNDTSTSASGIPYKYITVNVSYQSIPNQPYAARGHSAHPSSEPLKRILAH